MKIQRNLSRHQTDQVRYSIYTPTNWLTTYNPIYFIYIHNNILIDYWHSYLLSLIFMMYVRFSELVPIPSHLPNITFSEAWILYNKVFSFVCQLSNIFSRGGGYISIIIMFTHGLICLICGVTPFLASSGAILSICLICDIFGVSVYTYVFAICF